MVEPEAEPVAGEAAPESTLSDPALLMRRAIRAVAAAEATVARSLADAARYRSDQRQRQATLIDGARTRSNTRPDVDLQQDATQLEAERVLRCAVGEYVTHLRDAGKAPERALVHLKELLRGTPMAELDRVERVDLMESAVRWGIEAYYRVAPEGDERDRSRA